MRSSDIPMPGGLEHVGYGESGWERAPRRRATARRRRNALSSGRLLGVPCVPTGAYGSTFPQPHRLSRSSPHQGRGGETPRSRDIWSSSFAREVAVPDRLALTFALLAPGTDFAGFRIAEVVGGGGMGVVYRAVDSALERTVALKVIAPEHTEDPAVVSCFKSEAKLAASIDHPNLVTIYGAGECGGVLFLAMQFVPGTDLQAVMCERRPLDLPRVNRIVEQVAPALDAAHASGLVHRDVKPANILLMGAGPSGHAYLTDFGLTKRLDTSTAGPTRSGHWVGTPDYAAPEQIRALDVDARTDVYSLGCVAHELLTGHPPYERESSIAKLWAHVAEPTASPCARRPELLPLFDSLIGRATAKEPDNRFPSAGALSDALGDAVGLQLASEAPDSADQVCTAEAPTADGDAATLRSPPSALAVRTNTDPKPLGVTPARPEVAPAVRDDSLGATVADRARLTDGPRPRASRFALVAGMLASAIVAVGLAIALSGGAAPRRGATTPRRMASAVTPAILTQDVGRLNAIVQLFIAGKRLSHVEHQYAAAAQNRRLVLKRLMAFHAPRQLRAAAETLRKMSANSLSFNLLMVHARTLSHERPTTRTTLYALGSSPTSTRTRSGIAAIPT